MREEGENRWLPASVCIEGFSGVWGTFLKLAQDQNNKSHQISPPQTLGNFFISVIILPLDVSTSSTQAAYKYFFLVDVSETKKIAVVFFPCVWILHPSCLERKVWKNNAPCWSIYTVWQTLSPKCSWGIFWWEARSKGLIKGGWEGLDPSKKKWKIQTHARHGGRSLLRTGKQRCSYVNPKPCLLSCGAA